MFPLGPYFLIYKIGVVNNIIFKFSCSPSSLRKTTDSASLVSLFAVLFSPWDTLPFQSQHFNTFKDFSPIRTFSGIIQFHKSINNRKQKSTFSSHSLLFCSWQSRAPTTPFQIIPALLRGRQGKRVPWFADKKLRCREGEWLGQGHTMS